MLERLQKIIARAGVTSRRHAEQLILAGAVSVNGQRVTELGAKADPDVDIIRVGSRVIRPAARKVYLLLHKPPQCVATMSDPEGRASLATLLHGVPGRVFPVGRLDYHSSGAILLTNDGELAARLLKVAGRVPQTCHLKVKGVVSEDQLAALRRSAGARITPLYHRRVVSRGPNAWYEATLRGEQGDALRAALARMGHPVEKWKRVKLFDLELASLPAGKFRYLSPGEAARLVRVAARAERSEPGDRGLRPQPPAAAGQPSSARNGGKGRSGKQRHSKRGKHQPPNLSMTRSASTERT